MNILVASVRSHLRRLCTRARAVRACAPRGATAAPDQPIRAPAKRCRSAEAQSSPPLLPSSRKQAPATSGDNGAAAARPRAAQASGGAGVPRVLLEMRDDGGCAPQPQRPAAAALHKHTRGNHHTRACSGQALSSRRHSACLAGQCVLRASRRGYSSMERDPLSGDEHEKEVRC